MASVVALLAALRGRDPVTAREIGTHLQVSQPTLSRLIVAAGERVCRVGRGRATRYALARSMPHLGTSVPLWQIDETGTPHRYGTLHFLAGGRYRYWLDRAHGSGELFEGEPPFVTDMTPQGFIGRTFAALYPQLNLPPRTIDWSEDQRLLAVARGGPDCAGDLILGTDSFDYFLAHAPRTVTKAVYPTLARQTNAAEPGSSAAGEQPKFAVFSDERHVLVKFAAGDPGPVTQRWRDLLRCEEVALETVREAGIPAALATVFDSSGIRFLEVERFDRVGARGRRGLLSLFAVNNAYLGGTGNWTNAAQDLLAERRINLEDNRRIRWLDTFGSLIANTDRHFGNLSFYVSEGDTLRLAPVYDMLPMQFAPQGGTVSEQRFLPRPPRADTIDVWADAARWAIRYWDRLTDLEDLSAGFRLLATECREAVRAAI